MPRLSALLGPEIWVKRDSCAWLSTGGNRTRKLEFLMAEAVAEGADAVMMQSATLWNHAHQTAAAATKLGMDCQILLEDRTGHYEPIYRLNGNVHLDLRHGATIEHRGPGLDTNAEMFPVADRMKVKGRKPHAIVGGESNATGALGNVNCALELLGQMVDQRLAFDHIVSATGSAGTHAGLIVGLKALNAELPFLGTVVRAPQEVQEGNVFRLARAVAEKHGLPGLVDCGAVVANSDDIGQGYCIPADSTLEAIDIFARQEAILLDPVYCGKATALPKGPVAMPASPAV